jgi:membrane-associated phospholipid phosphatase
MVSTSGGAAGGVPAGHRRTADRTGSDRNRADPAGLWRESGLWREAGTAARRLIVPVIAIAAGMVLLGLLVTHVLAQSWVGSADLSADRDLAAHRTGALVTATAVFTRLASTPVVIALTGLAAVAFRLAYHRWREAAFVVCAVAGETLIFLLTTLLVHRDRPPVTHLDAAPPTSDFPSGHTAASVCLWGAVAAVILLRHRRPLLRAAVVAVAVLMPLLVGTSRIYRGMHFPTDVLAGLLLGATWLSLSTRRYLYARGPAR